MTNIADVCVSVGVCFCDCEGCGAKSKSNEHHFLEIQDNKDHEGYIGRYLCSDCLTKLWKQLTEKIVAGLNRAASPRVDKVTP